MENSDTQFLQCLRWRKHLTCLIEFMNINNVKKSPASKEADVAHVKNNPATESTKKKVMLMHHTFLPSEADVSSCRHAPVILALGKDFQRTTIYQRKPQDHCSELIQFLPSYSEASSQYVVPYPQPPAATP